MIAAPLFHSWGYAHWSLGISLSSTVVLKRKFDPEATLSLTAQHQATALVVVPVMIQRILELDDEVLSRYDLSKLRVVPVSGSALPGSQSDRWMDLFGENLFNLYGSTEVAWADDRHAEGPARGARHRRQAAPRHRRQALRRGRHRVKQGEGGRIFVGNEMQFEGYTGGGQQGRHRRPDVVRRRRPLRRGRAPVRRRPRRRHDRLGRRERVPARGRGPALGHETIAEAAVFGVDDEKFGQR
jgi:fatty-acyl-CoA synthase